MARGPHVASQRGGLGQAPGGLRIHAECSWGVRHLCVFRGSGVWRGHLCALAVMNRLALTHSKKKKYNLNLNLNLNLFHIPHQGVSFDAENNKQTSAV